MKLTEFMKLASKNQLNVNIHTDSDDDNRILGISVVDLKVTQGGTIADIYFDGRENKIYDSVWLEYAMMSPKNRDSFYAKMVNFMNQDNKTIFKGDKVAHSDKEDGIYLLYFYNEEDDTFKTSNEEFKPKKEKNK